MNFTNLAQLYKNERLNSVIPFWQKHSKGEIHGDERCSLWFEKIHEYTWSKFPDPKRGEWWAQLNRQGERLSDLKGGKWKGCFHVPRTLFYCWEILELH